MKWLIQSILVLLSTSALANDGAFFVNGNQLIPLNETDIAVTKEVLTIKRKNAEQIAVTVYYEFFNRGNDKKMTVGFEAATPSGDADPTPKNKQHPNIYYFTVEMNNNILPYTVSLVSDSLYYKNGKVEGTNLTKDTPKSYEWYGGDEWNDYIYVYHFETIFKRGTNTIKHTYTFDLSGGIEYNYDFLYVLSAAMRWGNHQINDFTLIIDMGEFQDFYMDNTPFEDTSKWTIPGVGKVIENISFPYWEENAGNNTDGKFSRFLMREGQIRLQTKDFKPKGELYLFSKRFFPINPESFNYTEQTEIPIYGIEYESAADETSKKILRNLPFARRGYIFSAPELNKYFNNQIWYIPDPNYKADTNGLTLDEQMWIKRWK